MIEMGDNQIYLQVISGKSWSSLISAFDNFPSIISKMLMNTSKTNAEYLLIKILERTNTVIIKKEKHSHKVLTSYLLMYLELLGV